MRSSTIALTLCITVLAGFLIAGLAGCQSTERNVSVVSAAAEPGWEAGPALGLKAPAVKFVDRNNKSRSIRPNTGWITVVAFIPTKGDECAYLSPELTELATRYSTQPVRVIQVAVPAEKCQHEGCVETCHLYQLHLMAICDSGRVVYDALGHPPANEVILFGGDGTVIAIASVKGLSAMHQQLDQLGAAAQQKSLPDYAQTYSE